MVVRLDDRTPRSGTGIAVVVPAELGFVLVETLAGVPTSQALLAAVGATAIGVFAVRGGSMLMTIGRRLFSGGGPPDED